MAAQQVEDKEEDPANLRDSEASRGSDANGSRAARTERAKNNSGNVWTSTMPLSCMNMPMLSHAAEISPCPIRLIHGENAHSLYFSEIAYLTAAEPKELLIVPGARHTDLYDKTSVIPFELIEAFFREALVWQNCGRGEIPRRNGRYQSAGGAELT